MRTKHHMARPTFLGLMRDGVEEFERRELSGCSPHVGRSTRRETVQHVASTAPRSSEVADAPRMASASGSGSLLLLVGHCGGPVVGVDLVPLGRLCRNPMGT